MPRSVTSKFGYDRTKSTPVQMRTVLQTENEEEEIEEILSTIRRLTREELDLDRVANVQEHQIDSIKRKIAEQYPATFGLAVEQSEKNLHYLHKYILYTHAADRSTQNQLKKRKKNRKENTKAKGPSASHDLRSSAVERSSRVETTPSGSKNASNSSKSTKRNQENIAPSRDVADRTSQASKSSRASTTSSQAAPPKEPVFSQESSFRPSRTVTISQRPSAAIPSTHGRGESAGSSHQYRAAIQPLHAFLDACVPSMTHHLQSFVEFGCSTPEHLFGMSMWQPGMVHEVLDRLPPNVHGERLSEMDKLIIQNHILTYFKS